VTLWDPDEKEVKNGENNFKENVDDLVRNNILSSNEANAIISRMHGTNNLSEAGKNADFISEAVVENLEIKQDIFKELEKHCSPQSILTSNTSTLLATDISKKMKNNRRMMVAHFWNPAYLVPLVEVSGHKNVDEKAVKRAIELLKNAGKKPIYLKKEILGFIGNRLMHAMIREGISLVQKGIVAAEDIDKVVTQSFGPRFANLGPLEYMDLNGLDLLKYVQEYLLSDLDVTKGILPLVEEKNNKNELGVKSGKGFYDWSQRDSSILRGHRDKEFIRRMREQ
jgi:3-hydroxybutyryl-CoA dehydrogenase